MQREPSAWYAPLAARVSRGSTVAKARDLGDLHRARAEHLGQFWTPLPLARLLWEIVEPAIDAALAAAPAGARVSLFDSGIGSARTLSFADPAKHELFGCDIDGESVAAVVDAMSAAGFTHHVETTCMTRARVRDVGVALLNPAFSLAVSGPDLEPFAATNYGPFGPNTSTLSHAYAIDQALAAADIVAAIVPESFAREVLDNAHAVPRLQAFMRLPATAFHSESASVATAILVYGAAREPGAEPLVQNIRDLEAPLPPLALRCRATDEIRARLRVVDADDSTPTIRTPVTGDARVRLVRAGRRLRLQYACGLTEARVANAILREPVAQSADRPHRYPRGVRYAGEGALDLELHLAQPDPLASFEQLVAAIEAAGSVADVAPGVRDYICGRVRRDAVARVPYRHTVRVKPGSLTTHAVACADVLTGTARRTHQMDSGVWGSPVIRAGASFAFTRTGSGSAAVYQYIGPRDTPGALSVEDLHERFAVEVLENRTERWVTVHEGRLVAFPARAAELRRRAHALGLHEWLWDWQLDDVIELAMHPRGMDCWDPGLGKSRLAAALILLCGGRHNLVVVEPHLVDEMRNELGKLPLPSGSWQVITKATQLAQLCTINVISEVRLRTAVDPARPRRTYAKALRRKVATLVRDEAQSLANPNSERTRAVWAVSPKRAYLLSGTMIASYPRDILEPLRYVGGDGTARQPYGRHAPYLEARLRDSMNFAHRGLDAFADRFITLQWVTHEFSDGLTTGGKREVPVLRNVTAYRELLAPFTKRRVVDEPDVARNVRIPTPTRLITEVPWDDAHLAAYLQTADAFAEWYRETRRRATGEGHAVNLVALLARVQAVQRAANVPHAPAYGFAPYRDVTSKQRVAVDRLCEWIAYGHKAIAFAHAPKLLDRVAALLRDRGIDALVIHGGVRQRDRTFRLQREFREGATPVLLASYGVARTGLNLPEADRVLLLERAWTPAVETQAASRVLRPQQRRDVVVEALNLAGSIDDYQQQMTEAKASAVASGLDWGEPEEDRPFEHLDAILDRMVQGLAQLRGEQPTTLREEIKRAYVG